MADWSIIVDEAVDAESPVTSQLGFQYRDNAVYNKENALRGGTHASGQRLVVARGTKTVSDTGTDLDLSSAVTFATDATDGDPDFGAAPVVILSVQEDRGSSETGWYHWDSGLGSSNKVTINRVFISSGTLDADGFTAEVNLTAQASGTFGVIIHWLAIGTPDTEAEYTTIASTDTDQDSPVEDVLTEGLRDNEEYNHDHAVRCGTNTHGVRLAIARGTDDFSTTSVSSYVHSFITFATDADDGDPNFLAPPIMLFSLEEDTSGTGVDWTTNDVLVERPPYIGYDWSNTVWVDKDECSVWYHLYNSAYPAEDIEGNLHWIAIGLVAVGE